MLQKDPLEFGVAGDRTNFLELQNTYLEVKCRILSPTGDKLEHDAAGAAATDLPFFLNNNLNYRFSECSIAAKGIKISPADGNYAKAFIETESSHNKETKKNRLKYQGSSSEEQANDFTKQIPLQGQLKRENPRRCLSLEELRRIFSDVIIT